MPTKKSIHNTIYILKIVDSTTRTLTLSLLVCLLGEFNSLFGLRGRERSRVELVGN